MVVGADGKAQPSAFLTKPILALRCMSIKVFIGPIETKMLSSAVGHLAWLNKEGTLRHVGTDAGHEASLHVLKSPAHPLCGMSPDQTFYLSSCYGHPKS